MSTVHEDRTLRNKSGIFQDRIDAGNHLAGMLEKDYKGHSQGMVLAIPSGGVPIGLALSSSLQMDFDLIIVRKVQIPGNTEAGFGAIALGGEVFCNQELLAALRLSQEQIDEQVDKVKTELTLRNALFRNDRPLPELKGKTVIIADDGLASGYTILAAIDAVRKQGAARVIVAVPTAPSSSISRVEPQADAIYCANIKDVRSFAVAEAYRNWWDLTRKEVMELLTQGIQGGGHSA